MVQSFPLKFENGHLQLLTANHPFTLFAQRLVAPGVSQGRGNRKQCIWLYGRTAQQQVNREFVFSTDFPKTQTFVLNEWHMTRYDMLLVRLTSNLILLPSHSHPVRGTKSHRAPLQSHNNALSSDSSHCTSPPCNSHKVAYTGQRKPNVITCPSSLSTVHIADEFVVRNGSVPKEFNFQLPGYLHHSSFPTVQDSSSHTIRHKASA